MDAGPAEGGHQRAATSTTTPSTTGSGSLGLPRHSPTRILPSLPVWLAAPHPSDSPYGSLCLHVVRTNTSVRSQEVRMCARRMREQRNEWRTPYGTSRGTDFPPPNGKEHYFRLKTNTNILSNTIQTL